MSSPLLSLQQAKQQILQQATAITQAEKIAIFSALNRICAEDIISPMNVPSFDNSAMDGYAIRMADLTPDAVLPVSAKIFAGQNLTQPWPSGTCLRIMTGAPVPAEADAVIMQEETESNDNGIRFLKAVKKGQNIRRCGEDIASGEVVIKQGEKLSISKLSVLASLGISQIKVMCKLKVAIFSTGDELCPIGQTLRDGQLYDTNRFTLHLMLNKLGCEVIDFGILPDNPQQISDAFKQADQQADVVISSGGVSVGEADYTKQILAQLGTIDFWKLAIKPGKPFAFGRLSHSLFCGLPGNPVSATVTFYQLVQPLLAKLSGHCHWQAPMQFKVPTTTALKKSPGRLDFQRGILSVDTQGQLSVASTGQQGSHIGQSLSKANCFIILEQPRGNVSIGETVTVEPFNLLLEA